MLPQSRRVHRGRVNRACNTCRKSRIRCDGVRPHCGTCQRRRALCSYNDGPSRGASRLEVTPSNSSSLAALYGIPDVFGTPGNHVPVTLDDDDVGVTAMGLISKSPKGGSAPIKERFGEPSAITFLHELRDTLGLDTITSRPDADHSSPQFIGYEERSPKPLHEKDIFSLPPRPLADHLVSCYFSKIHCLYPFVHKPAFTDAYQSLWRTDGPRSNTTKTRGLGLGSIDVSPTTFFFALNAVFALGCQFSDAVQVDREATSEAFFRLSKSALELSYLEKGDLALCQTLLLMAHYLQGSSTPNRCWHAIGMACREAQALGLHSTANDARFSSTEIQMRRRVWHGCAMLDLSSSTILGRPAMIHQNNSIPKPRAIDDCFLIVDGATCEQPSGVCSHVSWFRETLKLHDILRKILSRLYNNREPAPSETSEVKIKSQDIADIQSIIQIDAELQSFKASVPSHVDWDLMTNQNSNEIFMREKLLLKARFSYLKVLLYRPTLSRMIKAKRSCNQSVHGVHERYSLDCSVYCTEAAIDLVSIVHQTCTNELASVWFYNLFYTFTAASIIIIARLSPSIIKVVTKMSLQESLKKCYACFDHLKLYNVAAEQCAKCLMMAESQCLDAVTDDLDNPSEAIVPRAFPYGQELEDKFKLPEIGAEMPASEQFFRDLNFDDETLLDPFWFNLQF